LWGRNGSGKTTLLDAIAGVIKGRVVACGRDVSRLPPERRGLAYVQSVPVDPPTRVDKFLHMVARMHGTEAEVEEVVRRLGIESLLRRRSGLSTGQKQLVNLAAALLTRPCAFLMDEPTSHLDWLNKKTFNDVVKALGMPVLYVAHDPFEAMYVADVICVMEGGRILRCVREQRKELEQIYKIAESFWSPLR
jgi:molybdate/tungstate transport system ATP-binding protein